MKDKKETGSGLIVKSVLEGARQYTRLLDSNTQAALVQRLQVAALA